MAIVTEPTVELVEVPARATAVIREQTTWPQLGATIMRLLDRVWPVMKAEPMSSILAHDPFGENIILYLDSHPTIEVGVLVDGSFTPIDGLEPSQLPGGRVARAIHRGSYDKLGPTHEAVQTWCRQNGQMLTGVSWEHYGHWHEDPEQMETTVAYLLG